MKNSFRWKRLRHMAPSWARKSIGFNCRMNLASWKAIWKTCVVNGGTIQDWLPSPPGDFQDQGGHSSLQDGVREMSDGQKHFIARTLSSNMYYISTSLFHRYSNVCPLFLNSLCVIIKLYHQNPFHPQDKNKTDTLDSSPCYP